MSKFTRQMPGSPFYQGTTEVVPYTIDPTEWPGGTGSSPSIVVKEPDDNGIDVTEDVVTADASMSGDNVTFTLANLARGATYFVVVSWVVGSATFSTYGEWRGQA